MQLSARTSARFAAAPEAVFDAATDPANIPRMLKKRGPFPAALSVEGGVPPAVGARRKVSMGDGSVVGEEIVVLDRPRAYRYRWLSPPDNVFKLLIRGAESDWTFTAADGGTRLDWEYRFQLTSPLAWPLARPVVWLFQGWMRAGLDALGGLIGRG